MTISSGTRPGLRAAHRVALALVSLGAMVAVSGAESARPIGVRLATLHDLITSPASLVNSLALSPDGHSVVVESETHLLLMDIERAGAEKNLGEGLMPQWSPSGKRVAFYSNRSGSLQMWVWDSATGRSEPLTQLPGGVDPDPTTRIMGYTSDSLRLTWSADGTAIAFASRVAPFGSSSQVGPLVLDNSTPAKWTLEGVFANPGHYAGVTQLTGGREWGYRSLRLGESLASQLFIVHVDTRVLTQLTHGVDTLFQPAWSPDGRRLAASSVSSSAAIEDLEDAVTDTHHSWRSQIVTIDAHTGLKNAVVSDRRLNYYPQWSPDGSRIAFLSSAGIYTLPTLRAVRLEDGKLLTAGPELRSYDFAWTTRNDELLVSYGRSDAMRFAYARPGSQALSRPILSPVNPVGAVPGPTRWSQAANGDLAWLHDAQLWYLAVGSKMPVLIADLDRSPQDVRWGHVKTVTWHNSKGEELQGGLLLPPGYRAGTKYPMIVDAYPYPGSGASPGNRGWLMPWEGNQAWASLGYLIFKPRPRAPFYTNFNCSSSVGHCEGLQGVSGWTQGLDDLLSGVDQLVREGVADPTRMCVYGHSNGGGFVSYLVSRTHVFKCAVVLAPALTDLVRPAVLNTDGGAISSYVGGMTIETHIGEYISMSSIFHLQQVTTPLLIAVGDNDGEFLLNAIELYNGVRRGGSEVTLVRYPGQGHLISGGSLDELWNRELTFFRRFLQRPVNKVY